MTLVPPIKCQGIKTKLVPVIRECIPNTLTGRWIEPFLGSGVVAFNIQPERALLADKNRHLIQFYQQIQQGHITPALVQQYLEDAHIQLSRDGQIYYNAVRTRFNVYGDSLDFLFLNRACFNGVMRFNQRGEFNVPFGHKPERFRQAYITKIVNQVRNVQNLTTQLDWHFEVIDFRQTLFQAMPNDFVYADPPYWGRHTDYFTAWSETDEQDLIMLLQERPIQFLLSTWHHNRHRVNPTLEHTWRAEAFTTRLVEHFYHIGADETHRVPIIEALIGNYPFPNPGPPHPGERVHQLRLDINGD